jgi:hypothetical protein
LLAAAAPALEGGARSNALYEELRTRGVAVGPKLRAKLPEPSMADGLDARTQRAVIDTLAGTDYSVEDYGIDVYLIAYGDLVTVAGKDFLSQWKSSNKDRQVHILTPAELTARKLTEHVEGPIQERFGHTVFPILEQVQISASLQAMTTRGTESVLGAAHIDPRFNADGEFPNRWRSIGRDACGQPVLGEPQPYDAAGLYIKVTKLHEPEGALFAEYHVVFAEPKGWFGGANVLRAKMPILAQSEVRAFRRDLLKARKKE